MRIDDYPSNSKTKKKVDKVIDETVELKKKSEKDRIKDKIIVEEIPKIKNHIIYDILIPNVKRILSDSFNTILFGNSGDANRISGRRNNERVSYRKYYDEPNNTPNNAQTTMRYQYEYEDIIFPSRTSAYRVLDSMKDIITEYGSVSISDMYDLSGMSCPHTYANYGWILNTRHDLESARVVPTGDGYMIKLSSPVQLD